MLTFLIHIKGLVQGVGFRPHVYKIAKAMQMKGCVSNEMNGVNIKINGTKTLAEIFLERITSLRPENAIITHTSIQLIDSEQFVDFAIIDSHQEEEPDLLIPPDYAICDSCKNEIDAVEDRRHLYAFTTCLSCGPRYSIIETLPYDRKHTTMKKMSMCFDCEHEYHEIENKRHYSQTNSCPECAIQMHLFNSPNSCIDHKSDTIIPMLVSALDSGKIIAVKNTGGYLLMCDATQHSVIQLLRKRKKRPTKPFALLYPNIERLAKDAYIRDCEKEALNSKAGPIVLCPFNKETISNVQWDIIAPFLDKLGVMLPSSPLLYLITKLFNKPLVATSANLSGSPIVYKDVDALEHLFEFADYVLTFDREIITPQDDSVIQFTENEKKIILRRSRGLAPNYFPHPFENNKENILATGGELKSAFAFLTKKQLFVSQFLGDQSHLESQEAFAQTFKNFQKIFKCLPEKVLVDQHPNYFVTEAGKEIANDLRIPLISIQHHKAHFASVLAENNLMGNNESILGFIWDGTGFGEDGNIWGSELFSYQQGLYTRLSHLAYFPVLLGDKMSKEPRLSALSLLKQINEEESVKKYFTTQEWQYYKHILEQPGNILTSSMGRFLDGIACLIGFNNKSSFEGEVVMQLEAAARNSYAHRAYYSLPLEGGIIQWGGLLQELLMDIAMNKERDFIARKVMNSLVALVNTLSKNFGTCQLAFSGGVFQNALLVDLLIENIGQEKILYFQKEVSPNDEGLSFGQIAYYLNNKKSSHHSEVKNKTSKSLVNKNILVTS